jgi:2-methylcitrate dehydratase PrpD
LRKKAALQEELAKSNNLREREIAGLRREQDGLRTQFEQEIAEEIAKVRREQRKSEEGTTALPKTHSENPAQKEGLEQEFVELKVQFAQEKAKTKKAIQNFWDLKSMLIYFLL